MAMLLLNHERYRLHIWHAYSMNPFQWHQGQWTCDFEIYTKNRQFDLCCRQRHLCFSNTSLSFVWLRSRQSMPTWLYRPGIFYKLHFFRLIMPQNYLCSYFFFSVTYIDWSHMLTTWELRSTWQRWLNNGIGSIMMKCLRLWHWLDTISFRCWEFILATR